MFKITNRKERSEQQNKLDDIVKELAIFPKTSLPQTPSNSETARRNPKAYA